MNLTLSYVTSLNSEKMPEIVTSLENVKQQQARKIKESLQNFFE